MQFSNPEAQFEGAYALSYAYQHQGNFDTALYFLEKAQKKLSAKDRRQLRIWRMKSINHSKGGNWNQALKATDSLLALSEQWQDSLHLNIAHNTKGIIYRQQGQLNKALEAYHQSLKIAEHINDPQVANLHTNIAILYQDLGFSEIALEWFQKAHFIAKSQKVPSLKIRTLLNLGNHFKGMGVLDSADYYFQKLSQMSGLPSQQKGLLLQNLADLYILKKEPASAKIYLDSLSAMMVKSEDVQRKVEYHTIYAKWHKLQNNDSLTLAYFDSAIFLAREHQLMRKLLRLYYDKALLLEQQEQFRASLAMLKAFTQLEDSLANASDLKLMRDLISEIELENKKKGLTQKIEVPKTSNLLWYLLILFPIILFFLSKSRKKVTHTAAVSEQITEHSEGVKLSQSGSKEETLTSASSSPILLKSKNVVLPENMVFIKSEGHYLYIHTATNQNPLMERNSLKNLQNQLPPEQFIRIHRSYIVNIDYIKTISSQEVILQDQTSLPLSRIHKQQLKSNNHPLFS